MLCCHSWCHGVIVGVVVVVVVVVVGCVVGGAGGGSVSVAVRLAVLVLWWSLWCYLYCCLCYLYCLCVGVSRALFCWLAIGGGWCSSCGDNVVVYGAGCRVGCDVGLAVVLAGLGRICVLGCIWICMTAGRLLVTTTKQHGAWFRNGVQKFHRKISALAIVGTEVMCMSA